MKRVICLILVCTLLTACSVDNKGLDKMNMQMQLEIKPTFIIDEEGMTIEKRFNVPEGYKRIDMAEESFAHFLRNLKLKPHGSLVKHYDGATKRNYGVYDAVVDMDIGKRNLQQCADAVMRLRGEYLYKQKKYDQIHFNLTNGFRMDYSKWMKGYRVKVEGNKTTWIKKCKEDNSYKTFRDYMTFVFIYAGTLSLSKELKKVDLKDMQIGDVLIQGGSPGHSVIVVDMAINEANNEKIYMLAQSYMPAQDIQILKNQHNISMSPWYELKEEDINTPEWNFESCDLKRFE